MNAEPTWHKSSYSANTGTCIELASSLDRIRDSKDPHGPTLRVNVAGFVQAVKAGRFDR
ncbi:DUF397 domain-containing protein [Saccharopolyspora sp. K220]|uniref:DUF397 domain-containing protein n=1 Tax=Saccharopolyspora soli TaxID=2926618 RepID=UPI001F56696A|nr:DUF397 domain-containing protein [Saccharopolyspora soli]MCI2420730.1 DUF397 domain-containing protein [Saccharopolyspora soli]